MNATKKNRADFDETGTVDPDAREYVEPPLVFAPDHWDALRNDIARTLKVDVESLHPDKGRRADA